MPSVALLTWRNDRMARLAAVDAHCVAAAALLPPNPLLAEESLCGYVMLLSGHFQGFCRDLYFECGDSVVAAIAAGLRPSLQRQFAAELKLNSSNATVETIKKDFERFAIILDFDADPANHPRVTRLGHLNKWRNAVAHQKPGVPVGVPPLTLAAIQDWRISCDELATWLDGVTYNELVAILGVAPW